MSNAIEFVIRMRDLMSSGVAKLAATSQSSFTKMSAHVDQHKAVTKTLDLSYDQLRHRIAQTERTIRTSNIPEQIAQARQELERLQRQSDRHIGNLNRRSSTPMASSGGIGIMDIAAGSMLGDIAQQGIAMAGSAVISFFKEIAQRSAEKEQAITGLTTFLGKEGATAAYNNIRQDAAATPFDTASLLEVNRSLISAGLNAADARRDTLNLANAVAAVGGGNDVLSRMAANMQQIKTVGKATAMDIRQFGIAGINIYEMLARATGKNIEQVKEMDVSYQQLAMAMELAASKGGIYEGAMAAQSQTRAGRFSTVKDNFSNAFADIGDAFAPITDPLLDLAVEMSNKITPLLEKAKPYIESIGAWITGLVSNIREIGTGTGGWSDYLEIAKTYAGIIFAHFKRVGSFLYKMVSSIIDFVKNSEILKDVFRLIGWWFDKISKIIGWVLDKVLWFWENVIKPVLKAIDNFYKWLKGGGEVKVTATQKVVGAAAALKQEPKAPQGAATMLKNQESSASTGSTITGGGPKTINISIGKFFDTIQFTTMDSKESIEELEKLVLECLARVVFEGAKTANV